MKNTNKKQQNLSIFKTEAFYHEDTEAHGGHERTNSDFMFSVVSRFRGNLFLFVFLIFYFSYFISHYCFADNRWKTYTNTNFINDIIGDSNYLYCATQGGFTIFSRVESSFSHIYTNVDGLKTNRISCLMFDKSGKIWLGTYRGIAIYELVTGIIEIYDRFDEITQSIITCLSCSGDTVLVGTQNGLFVIDTKGTSSFSDDNIIIPMLPSGCAQKIFSLQVSNDFWIGACPGVVRLNRNLQTYTTYLHPFGDSVKAMVIISDSLYLATERGIARYNGSDFTPILYFPENYVVFDLEYAENKFYIATTGGLLQYDWSNSSFILNEEARGIFILDGMWLGIGGLPWFGGGLRHYYNGTWNNYWSSGLASNNVSCAISDRDGTLYVLHYPTQTYNYRTISYKKTGEAWQLLYDTIIDNYIAAVDKNNYIWFGHWLLNGGLSRYNPQNHTWYAKTLHGYRGVIGALGIDNNDVKWIYNQYGYSPIIAVDANENEIEFDIPGILSPAQGGYEFTFDSQNRVWLGASTVGLVMIDYKNTLSDFSDDTYRIFDEGLPGQEVNSVAVDAQNRVWCATVEGAAVLEGDSFRVYNTNNTQHRLLSNKVVRLKTDSWGNVWFLCTNGLSQYNIYNKEWTSYTPENSGLISNVENDDKFYRWLFIDEQIGFLLISTKEGISQFNYNVSVPESLVNIRIYPNPFIVSEHRVITFDSLPTSAVIKIYTIEGKFITELTPNRNFGGIRWEPDRLQSGIYFAVVGTDKKTQIAKFAIIR